VVTTCNQADGLPALSARRTARRGCGFCYVYVLSERIPVPFADLVQKVKLTQNVRKKMLFAVVDGESDLTFTKLKKRTQRGKMTPLTVDLSGKPTPPFLTTESLSGSATRRAALRAGLLTESSLMEIAPALAS